MNEYVPSPKTAYTDAMVDAIAPEVWKRLAGNGSLRMNIDTDVDCYGDAADDDESVAEARDWMRYFVRSTINRLIDGGHLSVGDGG